MDQILIVDDCEGERALLRHALGEDYAVSDADDVSAARTALVVSRPDLILLDIEMPREDGFGFAAEVRRNPHFADVPIIFLASRASPQDKVMAFAIGGQDCIEKPVAPEELRARVATRLRESRSRPVQLRHRDLVLCPERLCFTSDAMPGRETELTATELRLLQYLMRRSGEVVSREQLILNAWNGRVVSERTIDTHVWTLRKKLEVSSCAVETVRGVGYRMV